MNNIISFPSIHSFSMQVSYLDIDSQSKFNQFEHHIHPECEIYLNISGDVAFMVENQIYPISTGSVIITKPHEYHHCIYYSNERHRHYWILFSADNNEKILDIFFNRKSGEKNLLMIAPSKIDRLIYILEKFNQGGLTPVNNYRYFFEFLEILNTATKPSKNSDKAIDSDLKLAIRYINDNISYHFTIKDLAKASNTSISTLERHFRYFFGISPSEYIKQRKLGIAVELLNNGSTVTEACFNSGFADCSKFISFFKKNIGMTPLKYKKKFLEQQ